MKLLERLKKTIKHYHNYWIPNDAYPSIVDCDGSIINCMILYSSPDDQDPVAFTKHRIRAYDYRHTDEECGTFGISPIITGFVYPLNELRALSELNALIIRKGTSRKFLNAFYENNSTEEKCS